MFEPEMKRLCEADVVLTQYSVLAAEVRACFRLFKDPNPNPNPKVVELRSTFAPAVLLRAQVRMGAKAQRALRNQKRYPLPRTPLAEVRRRVLLRRLPCPQRPHMQSEERPVCCRWHRH